MATTMAPTLQAVNMKDGTSRLKLNSPYHPSLPSKAKALGGRFDGTNKAWYFDPRDTERVRQMVESIYGIDPMADAPAETVTVRVRLAERSGQSAVVVGGGSLWLFGREIISKQGRDIKPKLGEGAILIEGDFATHGGSARNPDIGLIGDSAVIEVRDVPKAKVEAAQAEYGDAIEIVETTTPDTATTAEAQILALAATLSPEARARIAAQITSL